MEPIKDNGMRGKDREGEPRYIGTEVYMKVYERMIIGKGMEG
jgi:hypothetical protein